MKKKIILFSLFALPLFANPVALITGANRGVGLATAEFFIENGYRVYGTIRPSSPPPITQSPIHFLQVDLFSEASIQLAVEEILRQEGRIDLLINNAGYALVGPVESLKREEMQEQMEINFFAPVRMIQAVLPAMRKQGAGHILNISSTDAVITPPFGSLYAASKAALESLSESLAVEVAPYNIAVSIVEPGLLTTQFSVFLGTRDVSNHPYQSTLDEIACAIQERSAYTEILPSQSGEEIARILLDIAQDPTPKLRYQTSEAAAEEVKTHLLHRAADVEHIQPRLEELLDH